MNHPEDLSHTLLIDVVQELEEFLARYTLTIIPKEKGELIASLYELALIDIKDGGNNMTAMRLDSVIKKYSNNDYCNDGVSR